MTENLDSILSFYDTALESLEYVCESAQLEILLGDDSFIPLYEAANDTANNQNVGWFAKLKQSVITFIRSAMSNIRSAINKVGNANREKKASKMKENIGNQMMEGKDRTIDVTPDQCAILLNTEIDANLKNFKALSLAALRSVQRTGKTDNEWIENYKKEFSKHFTKNTNSQTFHAKGSDITNFLNISSRLLNTLNSNFDRVNDYVNGLKNGSASTSQIRLATSYTYNFMTKLVRQHYNISMELARTYSSGK